MRRLLKFLRLQPSYQWLLAVSWATLLGCKIGLRLVSFQRLRRLCTRLATPPAVPVPHAEREVIWALDIASRYVPGGHNCLARALTAYVLLARRGVATELRIGVARPQNRPLEAHAWLEREGRVLIGELENFQRFTPFPPINEGHG